MGKGTSKAGNGANNGVKVDFTRGKDFDYSLYSKLPKKNQVENITDIGKDKTIDGTRYRAVIKFDDGFTRSIAEYTLSDFKYYVDVVLNKDRTAEF